MNLKKLSFLLLTLYLLVGFSSCGSDGDDLDVIDGTNGTESAIVGSWSHTKVEFEIEGKHKEFVKALRESSKEIGKTYRASVVFNSDGSYQLNETMDGESNEERGTYMFQNGKLHTIDRIEGETTIYSVFKSGKSLILSEDATQEYNNGLREMLEESGIHISESELQEYKLSKFLMKVTFAPK